MSSLHYTASLANICQIIAGHISCNSQTLQIITRHDRARDWKAFKTQSYLDWLEYKQAIVAVKMIIYLFLLL